MEATPLLPGSLAELAAAHPEIVEVTPGTLAGGAYGYMHAPDEAEMLAKLAAELGG